MPHTMPSTRQFSEAQTELAKTRRDAKHALRKAAEATASIAALYDQLALAYRERGAQSGATYAEGQMREYEAQSEAIAALLKLFPRAAE